MKIVFFGTPQFVAPCLLSLQEFQVVTVVTSPDVLRNNKAPIPSPVKKKAQELQIPVLTPMRLDQDFAKKISLLEPDFLLVASYGKIIPGDILQIPRKEAINIHPSLLPKYRGPSPLQAAILNGEKTTGISILQMDTQVDHGPLFYQEKVSVDPSDTFLSLADKTFKKASEILPDVLTQIAKGQVRILPQDHQKATFTRMFRKTDGYFEISNPPPPAQLDRMIRAFYPWPTVWTYLPGQKLLKILPGPRFQMEGKKPLSLPDFFNGYPQYQNISANLKLGL